MTKILINITFGLLTWGCSQSPPNDANIREILDIKYSRLKSEKLFKIIATVDETTGKILKSDTLPHSIKCILNYTKTHSHLDSTEGIPAIKALDLAKNVLTLRYDKQFVNECEPLNISLIDNCYWYVTGSSKKEQFGGWPEIIILKANGQIIYSVINK